MPSPAAPLRACLLVLSTLCCVACASPAPVVLPAALRTCQAEPAVPDNADDVAFAEWVAGVAFAGRDCRSALARVVELVGDP